ncbi:MAG TPA: efflux RND transporter periplasmic adaptor subunit [Candidatus Acidoferrales bacterium]|nr:efflux RND transporter periplasmic adaptor subunit [Candidatus Acidoferrales bacterium]
MAPGRIPFAVLAVCLAGAGLVSCTVQGAMKSADSNVPVASVKQTNVQLHVNATGELRSTKSVMLVAPPIAGGTLQIIHMAKAGTQVKAGDPIIEFDPSQQEYNLSQNRSDYEQAEQEIVSAKDNAAVQASQDQTALLKAQFDVRQAELQVGQNELVSAIDAQKNQLALDEAKRALAQLQQDIQSHAASGQATIALDEEKAHKAKLAMDQAQENIKNMRVTSPIDGLVVIRQNENAAGGFFFSGMTLPEFQEGDQVNPGSSVADVVDMSQMEIAARVSESDRVNVKIGQAVRIYVDALPGETFEGKVKTTAGSGGGFFFDSGPGKKSDVTVQLEHPDSRLRPGFTAHLTILGDHLEKALTIPREAVFEKDSKPIVYVKSGNGFEPRPIQIRYLTEGQAVITGLTEGTQVALVNPEQQPGGSQKPAGQAGPAVGPGKP